MIHSNKTKQNKKQKIEIQKKINKFIQWNFKVIHAFSNKLLIANLLFVRLTFLIRMKLTCVSLSFDCLPSFYIIINNNNFCFQLIETIKSQIDRLINKPCSIDFNVKSIHWNSYSNDTTMTKTSLCILNEKQILQRFPLAYDDVDNSTVPGPPASLAIRNRLRQDCLQQIFCFSFLSN